MSKPYPSAERFHALDATRAFALLLGVGLHAALSFVPSITGWVIVDVSGHWFFNWFCFSIHTFRMQLFYMIAGFFARMLYQKRGFTGFLKNRLCRIGLPFLVFWPALVSLNNLAWTWGGNISGGNLIPVPLGPYLRDLFTQGLIFKTFSQGGSFHMAHLWFLYYLLLLYVLAVALRWLILKALPDSLHISDRADRFVAQGIDSPRLIACLTLGMGLFLWRMDGWFGVDTPAGTLVPSMPVLVLYGTFFGLGWLIQRQASLLQQFARHWRWQVMAGTVLTVILYFASDHLDKLGVNAVNQSPWIGSGQILNWPRFLAGLKEGATPATARPAMANLWQHIPEPERAVILKTGDNCLPEVRTGVCNEISKLLSHPDLFSAGANRSTNQPPAAEIGTLMMANRATLEELYGAEVIRHPRKLSWYQPVKFIYSMGYSLTMWLLVFGILGFFQATFTSHTPVVRYIADSAYWIYLLHMPLVPFLQVWMGRWVFPGLLKFLLINLITLIILFLTYHLFVRSTILGKFINGQRYPFTPLWPWRPAQKPEAK